jgi:hypothetical protein
MVKFRYSNSPTGLVPIFCISQTFHEVRIKEVREQEQHACTSGLSPSSPLIPSGASANYMIFAHIKSGSTPLDILSGNGLQDTVSVH